MKILYEYNYDLLTECKQKTQQTFACSKSTVEILEKGMKYVQK